jgi:hypothetical protein
LVGEGLAPPEKRLKFTLFPPRDPRTRALQVSTTLGDDREENFFDSLKREVYLSFFILCNSFEPLIKLKPEQLQQIITPIKRQKSYCTERIVCFVIPDAAVIYRSK